MSSIQKFFTSFLSEIVNLFNPSSTPSRLKLESSFRSQYPVQVDETQSQLLEVVVQPSQSQHSERLPPPVMPHQSESLEIVVQPSQSQDSESLSPPVMPNQSQSLDVEELSLNQSSGQRNQCSHTVKKAAAGKKYSKNKKVKLNRSTDQIDPFERPFTVEKKPEKKGKKKVKLGSYKLNYNILKLISKNQQSKNISHLLKEEYPFLAKPLSPNNYSVKFHHLLDINEVDGVLAMQKFDMHDVCLIKDSLYLTIELDGLEKCKPSLINGDSVKIVTASNKLEAFSGIINEVDSTRIFFNLHEKFQDPYNGESVSIRFSSSRSSYVLMHNAIERAVRKLGYDILIPTHLNMMKNVTFKPELKWFNPNLNEIQKSAVFNFVNNKYNHPYILIGPPGTGKSVTLVEIVFQVLTSEPDSRIIIVTPSNNAAFLIMDKMLKNPLMKPGTMLRLLSYNASKMGIVPEHLKKYCVITGTDELQSEIEQHRITISTMGSIGNLMRMSFPYGHFTHLLVDEVSQAIEPEILIPMSLLDRNYGKILISGDPMQLGPVVMSNNAVEFGLGISFLERIISTSIYDEAGSPLVSRLLQNYRSIPSVLEVPNKLFYNGTLQPCKNTSDKDIIDGLELLCSVILKNNVSYSVKSFPGIIFHGMQGNACRDDKSPSWFNLDEAHKVYNMTCQLYEKNFTPDDIGIVTPYAKQVKCIKELFDKDKIKSPKVGSVEVFQGQERKIMIISMVRSTESLVPKDIAHRLGFISLPNRVNVALTRAQLVTIIFGDPYLLSSDPLWRSIIANIQINNGYIGCDFPQIAQDPLVDEISALLERITVK